MSHPTHFATPPGEVPADHTPPRTVGRDTFSQACARALKQPVIVTDIGDGALLVEPLHFHRVVRRAGREAISKFHVEPITLKGGCNNV